MTSEIAVMNKSGAALAADSAVTVSVPGPRGTERKIFNTANKLFALSKHAPVGIMTFGNAQLMGVPWETIIKMYRRGLARKRFRKLSDYCTNFLAFLAAFPVSEDAEAEFVLRGAHSIFPDIRAKLDRAIEAKITAGENVDETTVRSVLRSEIAGKCADFRTYGQKSALARRHKTVLARKYRKPVIQAAQAYFENRPLTAVDRSRLVSIVINAASVGPLRQAGVVIAGYGEDECFPSLFEYDVSAILCETVVKRDGSQQSVKDANGVAIVAFAQANDVTTFIEGMGRDLQSFLKATLAEMLQNDFPARLAEAVAADLGLDEAVKQRVLSVAQKMGQGSNDAINKRLNALREEKYVAPIITATRFLEKDQLAAMAETLVNLVSFRKQVTLDAETVGGPTDVAVITKGDGLVWIKRKHYFEGRLNHHFFANYFDHGDQNAKAD